MEHANRWDLPKGHVDPGESDLECAFRELEEETGIEASQIRLDSEFTYRQSYRVRSDRGNKVDKEKELIIYLAWLQEDVEIEITEHIGFEWFDWDPPHLIQDQTINPLLEKVEEHFDD